MRVLRFVVEPGGQPLVAEIPTGRWERLRGLLGRDDLPSGRGLLLEHTRSIHTIGMRRPIRVALLDGRLTVLTVHLMPPWRLILPRRRVRHVLECSVRTVLLPGDALRLVTERPG